MTQITKPLSRKQIRAVTSLFRKKMDLEEAEYIPIVDILEYVMPAMNKNFVFEIVNDDDLDAEARFFPIENKIKIRESVYDAACDDDSRSRFTIAHEIGHAFLHNEDTVSFARNGINVPAFKDPEWQANTFAAELLAPPYIVGDMNIEEIVDKCKVSRQVAEIQKKYNGIN